MNWRARAPYELIGVACLGMVGASLVTATGGRLALQPRAYPPTSWGGLLAPVSLDRTSVLPALLIGGISLTLLAWARACVLAGSQRLSPKQAAALLALWALPVALGPPILSLDVYSYAAHGMMLASSLDPYSNAPAALPVDSPQLAAVDPLWRFAQAPYGPLALAVFHGAHAVAGGSLIGAVVLLRLLALVEVALVVVGVLALAPPGRRAETLVLAVLNPIVLFQLLGAVHLETLMMALVVTGLLAVNNGRRTIGLVLLAAAAAVKWPAVLAVAAVVLWRFAPRSVASDPPASFRRQLPAALRDVGVVLIATAGFVALVPDGLGWLRVAGTPTTVPTGYSPTSILADLAGRLLRLAGAEPAPDALLKVARVIGLAASLVVIAWLFATIRKRTVAATAGWAMLTLAMLGPVLHPWYLAWGLILLAIAPTSWQRYTVLSVTAAGSFLALQHCSLLLAGHPELLRWLRAHGSAVAVGGYITAAGLVIGFSPHAPWAARGRAARGHDDTPRGPHPGEQEPSLPPAV
ncbi:polyprenol phosphomannose-dependent alpha 1,6 mannosyltransferase MptB [Frankia sp. AgB32]|uniref:polyprenol phosphomannose-dependent alpha 1,6 mannosyltransferase MptB n=1 Tax=Frankia sp. AgB32 TaxID=631119 RepID=UPI00200BD482|nr:polyprenol phosphomannose-dependent alpha 1,6 mannosyltransferase MptB [Frankia sp. AgB32]MCK9896898.1 polyprenol phosphomannose-dependent alpha 1,6 mannosyltransferase MptB [Frankia sp. AgB32]